jgi:hypothetical protein
MSDEKDKKPRVKNWKPASELEPDVFDRPVVHQAMHPAHRVKIGFEKLKKEQEKEDK